jgi:hypothetical protein
MAMLADTVDGVIGIDTHRHRDTLAAAAVTQIGGVLAQTHTSADEAGYQHLLGFARSRVPGRRVWAREAVSQPRQDSARDEARNDPRTVPCEPEVQQPGGERP